MVPKNITFPFLYVCDVLKDSLQLALLVIAVGGPLLVIKNPFSFTSVVSKTVDSRSDFVSMLKSLISFLSAQFHR